jgi:hypothetical protein
MLSIPSGKYSTAGTSKAAFLRYNPDMHRLKAASPKASEK